MKILDLAVLLGPNIHAPFPVLAIRLDLGGLEDWSPARLGPAFVAGLIQALPSLDHDEENPMSRQWLEGKGLRLSHVFERVVLELQNLAGGGLSFGSTRNDQGVVEVVVAYRVEAIGRAAAELTIDLLHSLLPLQLRSRLGKVEAFDWREARAAFLVLAEQESPSLAIQALLAEAKKRGIPGLWLAGGVLQLGHGRGACRLRGTLSGAAAHWGSFVAGDRRVTHCLLAELGLPLPPRVFVEELAAALAAARDLGWPVLLKPLHGSRGVSAEITDRASLEKAFMAAASARPHEPSARPGVMVEKALRGREIRVLVLGGRFVAAVERLPPQVVGDGRHSVAELVDEANCDPERGIGLEAPLARLAFDGDTQDFLAGLGLTPDSVPALGQKVELWPAGDWRRGGGSRLVTRSVHPEDRWLAERAARMLHLDHAAVDLMVDTTRHGGRSRGGILLEVEAQPDLLPFLQADPTQAPSWIADWLDRLVPEPRAARIPVVAIAGTLGKTLTARMVAHLLRGAGKAVGLACSDGIEIDGRWTQEGDRTGPHAAHRVLADPDVEIAVLELGRGGLARHGLGFSSADVGAVLNVYGDLQEGDGLETLEKVARLKRVVVDCTSQWVVLNADDPFTLAMAERLERPICYFSQQANNHLVREHVQGGGVAVVVEEGVGGQLLVWRQGSEDWPILELTEIPATHGGRAEFNVQNAMAATAIAMGLGLPLATIRAGLSTFFGNYRQAPGRFNVHEHLPFRVVVDAARQATAFEALVATLERFPTIGRRIVVLGARGDLREDDIRALARLAAGRFDLYVCRRDADLRGRRPDEVPRLIRDELLLAGVPNEQIEVIPEEMSAVQQALAWARPGDLVVLLADAVAATSDLVAHWRPSVDQPSAEIASAKPRSFGSQSRLAVGDPQMDRDFGE